MPRLRPAPFLAAAASAALLLPAAAHARVDAAVTIAGPDPTVLDLGGVAMAPDGTGGVVFRRFEDGAPHVYAARYDGERWDAPQRVDVGQRFRSTWPRIGAADGGRLVVTWAQEGPPSQDSMYSAVLPRGSSRFLAPTLVDFTIGDSRAAFPSLAMAPGGEAVLAYHRVTDFVHPLLGTGYVSSQIRLARFNGTRWSGVGVPVNRVPSAPLRTPTAESAPKVAIGADGGVVVAWQEPDESLQDRVWARRVFGSRLGTVLPVSTTTDSGSPQRGSADAIDVSVTDTGRAVVAYRQQPDPTNRTAGARVAVAQLDEPESGQGRAFGAPQVVAAPPAGVTGPPSVGSGGRFGLLVGWQQDDVANLGVGTGGTAGERFGLGPSLRAPATVVTQGVEARGTTATATPTGGGRVVVRQLQGSRLTAEQGVAARVGGPVTGLDIAGPGNGNALVGFAQGESDEAQIAVARVDSPPVPFVVEPPGEWSSARRPAVVWQAPANDPRPRHYTVLIDGRPVARRLVERTYRLPAGGVADGTHTVRIIATSRTGGGDTASSVLRFGVDRRRPVVSVRRSGTRRVRVTVTDPGARRASGVVAGGTTIDWGDDENAEGLGRRAGHSYARPGRYVVRVQAQDQAGNTVSTRTAVRIPAPTRKSGRR